MKRPTTTTPHSMSAHRHAIAALARLTHAVADLVEAIEATLTEWRRKARTKPHQKTQAAKG